MKRLINSLDNTCERCGKTAEGIGWFAKAYRTSQMRQGIPDPGHLCGDCAGANTGKRIAEEVLGKTDNS